MKKILLLNLKKSSEFVQELINNDSLDLKVRSDVLNLEETSSRKEIHESFKEALSGKNNQDNLQNLKLVYFGKTRTMDHEEIINYLNSLLRY